MKSFLASFVFFRDLYDRNEDVYDVIAEFCKYALNSSSKHTINSVELDLILSEEYSVQIPSSVLEIVIKKKLLPSGVLGSSRSSNSNSIQYVINKDHLLEIKNMMERFDEINKFYELIINDIIDYICAQKHISSTNISKEAVVNSLIAFFRGEKYKSLYYDLISVYILRKSKNTRIIDALNSVFEGILLYESVRNSFYWPDRNQWKERLTIFCDTDFLFSLFGINGIVFQKKSEELLSLIYEVNTNVRNADKSDNPKLISLEVLNITKKEIDAFFNIAEEIVAGKKDLDITKRGMSYLVDGCKQKADILTKRVKFDNLLKKHNIKFSNVDVNRVDNKFNLEDWRTIRDFAELNSEQDNEHFNEEVRVHLQIFSVIRSLRGTVLTDSLENCRYIFLSGNRLVYRLSQINSVKEEDGDYYYGTVGDYVTNYIWFKLKKGLTASWKVPDSMNVVVRSQIILSSKLSGSISKKVELLASELKQNKSNIDDIRGEYILLRDYSKMPEDINEENVDELSEFIFADADDPYHEIAMLKDKALKGTEEVRRLKRQNFIRLSKIKRKYKNYYSMTLKLTCFIIPVGYFLTFAYVLSLFLKIFIDETTATVLSLFVTIFHPIFKVSYVKKVHKQVIEIVKRFLVRYYLIIVNRVQSSDL